MKKNLLVTTALVAAFMTSNAMAATMNLEGSSDKEIAARGAFYSAEGFDTNGYENANLGNGGNFDLKYDAKITGQLTLDPATTVTGNKKSLTVDGWLTETQSGSNVSGANVVVNDGGLVLGNDLTVGNMTIGKGSVISLYNIGDDASGRSLEKVLEVNNTLTFAGDNEIRNAKQSGETANINEKTRKR